MYITHPEIWRGRIVGLVRSPGKRVGCNSPRGFESLPLRSKKKLSTNRGLFSFTVVRLKEGRGSNPIRGSNNGYAIETAREALLPPKGVRRKAPNHSLPLRSKKKLSTIRGLFSFAVVRLKEGRGSNPFRGFDRQPCCRDGEQSESARRARSEASSQSRPYVRSKEEFSLLNYQSLFFRFVWNGLRRFKKVESSRRVRPIPILCDAGTTNGSEMSISDDSL